MIRTTKNDPPSRVIQGCLAGLFLTVSENEKDKKERIKASMIELEKALEDSKKRLTEAYLEWKKRSDFEFLDLRHPGEKPRPQDQIRKYWLDCKEQGLESKNELFSTNFLSKLQWCFKAYGN